VLQLGPKAAVATTQQTSLTHHIHGAGTVFAWMTFQKLTLISCYVMPSVTLEEYAVFLGDLGQNIRARVDTKLVVKGELNRLEFGGALE